MSMTFRERLDSLCASGWPEESFGIKLRDMQEELEHWSLKRIAHDLRQCTETIAVLAYLALGDGRRHGPPRMERPSAQLLDVGLASLYPAATNAQRLALSAGLLLIFGYWDASHTAAQEAGDLGESRVSAYWHGIAHRQEPDAGNAAYWFRRVGRHPVFKPLAEAARPVLEDTPDLAARLIPQGVWDAFAFIDVAINAKGHQAAIAQELQRIEMLLLLEASLPD